MNPQLRNLIHDLRSDLEQINTCFNCIVFDLKDNQSPSEDDIRDLKKSHDRFEILFEELTKMTSKGLEYDVKK